MCKLNKRNDGRRIDPCMRKFIKVLNEYFGIDTVASCCGHRRYPPTVIVRLTYMRGMHPVEYMDLFSGIKILRESKFYKKDKQGYYYIPEVLREKEK